MKDAGNAIQMYQERIQRLEKALDLCRKQRDEHAGLVSKEEFELQRDLDEVLIMRVLYGGER